MESTSYEERRLRIIAASVVGNKVLDIGHAARPNSYLSQFYCVGYDLEESSDGNAGYVEEIRGDVKNIRARLDNRKFDSIVCGELIEHLENPYRFLRDLHSLLTDEGKLILSTPNPLGFPVFICEILRIKRFFYEQAHTFYFLPRWVERLLNLSGFKLCEIKPVGLWLPFAVLPYCPIALSYQLVYVARKNPRTERQIEE